MKLTLVFYLINKSTCYKIYDKNLRRNEMESSSNLIKANRPVHENLTAIPLECSSSCTTVIRHRTWAKTLFYVRGREFGGNWKERLSQSAQFRQENYHWVDNQRGFLQDFSRFTGPLSCPGSLLMNFLSISTAANAFIINLVFKRGTCHEGSKHQQPKRMTNVLSGAQRIGRLIPRNLRAGERHVAQN